MSLRSAVLTTSRERTTTPTEVPSSADWAASGGAAAPDSTAATTGDYATAAALAECRMWSGGAADDVAVWSNASPAGDYVWEYRSLACWPTMNGSTTTNSGCLTWWSAATNWSCLA